MLRFISLVLVFVVTASLAFSSPTPFNRETNAKFTAIEATGVLYGARLVEIERNYDKNYCVNIEDSALSVTGAVIDLGDVPANSIINDAYLYTDGATSTPNGGVSTIGFTCYSVSDNITLATASVFTATGFVDNVSTRSRVSAQPLGCEIRATIGSTSGGILGAMDIDLCVQYNTAQ